MPSHTRLKWPSDEITSCQFPTISGNSAPPSLGGGVTLHVLPGTDLQTTTEVGGGVYEPVHTAATWPSGDTEICTLTGDTNTEDSQ